MTDELNSLLEQGDRKTLADKIKEYGKYGEILRVEEPDSYKIDFDEFGEALLLEEEFYRKFFTQNIVDKWTKEFKKINGKILFVDDYSHTGGTKNTLQKMFEYNFPDTRFNFYSVFKKEDLKTFPGPEGLFASFGGGGVILPWTLMEDKAYTMLSEEEASLTAKPERELDKRKKALALKKEIKKIFSE